MSIPGTASMVLVRILAGSNGEELWRLTFPLLFLCIIGRVQGIDIQFLDYFCAWAVIFKGPLVRGPCRPLTGQVVEAGAYRTGRERFIRRITGTASWTLRQVPGKAPWP
ncbi:MAG: hypothetical protein ACLR0U_10035 [Enterocloster clostridioformis]